MKNMIYTSKNGETITFDLWEENYNWAGDNSSPYWVYVCPNCYDKHKKILKDKICDGSPVSVPCSVKGCRNTKAELYASFCDDDVSFT